MVESQKKNLISISCQTCGKKSATLARETFITPNPPLLNRYVYPLLANPKGKDFQTDDQRNKSCFLPTTSPSQEFASVLFEFSCHQEGDR